MKKVISLIMAMLVAISISALCTVSVFAEEDTVEEDADVILAANDADASEDTAAADDAATEAATEATEEETEAETEAAEEDEGVSDVSNIIGIVVAVIIGVGTVVAIILLAPRKTVAKGNKNNRKK